MGERKVLNKYYPADWDPDKIPRRKKDKDKPEKYVVRMMLPMSVRCQSCGEYMYKGRKFNSRRENAEGEDYLGIKKIRFFQNCTNCRAEFCIKTDPKNEDYEVESGATRNYEPWRDREEKVEAEHEQRAAADETDAMTRLENRTKDSKLEMDILDTLDELRTMSQRNNRANLDEVIARKRKQAEEEAQQAEDHLDEDDEALVRQAFKQPGAGRVEHRLEDDDTWGNLGAGKGGEAAAADEARQPPARPSAPPAKVPRVVVQPRPKVAAVVRPAGPAAQPGVGHGGNQAAGEATLAPPAPALSQGGSTGGAGPSAAPADGGGASAGPALAGLGAYGSSSDDDPADAA
mmetsp:Transcript_21464/g.72218  ORF Transcript_21464/g.72218 Transcript_21464/m.72218 type:complete len:346 (-) Transcript_21464:178-1215(-)